MTSSISACKALAIISLKAICVHFQSVPEFKEVTVTFEDDVLHLKNRNGRGNIIIRADSVPCFMSDIPYMSMLYIVAKICEAVIGQDGEPLVASMNEAQLHIEQKISAFQRMCLDNPLFSQSMCGEISASIKL